MPPNSPACINGSGGAAGDNAAVRMLPPQSNHPGGVNVGMFDGSVRFISETINFVTPNLPEGEGPGQVSEGPSRFGVWGAMGSPAGGETVTL